MKELIITFDETGKYSISNKGFAIHELIGLGEIIRGMSLTEFIYTKPIEEPKTQPNDTI